MFEGFTKINGNYLVKNKAFVKNKTIADYCQIEGKIEVNKKNSRKFMGFF